MSKDFGKTSFSKLGRLLRGGKGTNVLQVSRLLFLIPLLTRDQLAASILNC